MSLPALPRPESLTPDAIASSAQQVLAWAEVSNDVAEVRELANKWSAITEYVRRTSREGVAEAEAALRRLEMRVGELLGPATRDHDRSPGAKSITSDIGKDERHDFRLMAEHSDIVEEVIAASSDDRPPSRRKVIAAVRDTKQGTRRRPALTDAAESAGWNLRRAIERMQRITEDDRYPSHADAITTAWRPHMEFVIDAIEQLNNNTLGES